MVGSIKRTDVLCIFFFLTDFPVLSTPQKRTPCMPTPVALTTHPALWPAGCPWKQPLSWRKQRPVWQLWQWMWKMATPLLFWETAEGDYTRYNLDTRGSKEDKTNQGCSGGRGKKALSLVPREVGFLLKITTLRWSLLSWYWLLRMWMPQTVVTLPLVTSAPSQRQGWCILCGFHRYCSAHASCGWSRCIEILGGGWNPHTQQLFQLVPDVGWVPQLVLWYFACIQLWLSCRCT